MRLPSFLAASLLVLLAGCADDPATSKIAVDFPEPHADARDTVRHQGGNFTAHEQLMAWAADTGAHVKVSLDPNFGHFLQSIDGLPEPGASAYWALAVNGESSNVGMDAVVLRDGDTVTWTYTTF